MIEVCLESPQAAFMAQEYGAKRVELCASLLEGGTTPSLGSIKATRKAIDIGLFVLIRPRGGDFYYNAYEIEQMKYDIETCRTLGVDGVVIGALDLEGNLDLKTTRILIEAAGPMQITFHRAFDRCKDPFEALEQLIDLGVDRVLTSGQAFKIDDGLATVKKLVQQAKGRIGILPGSGVGPQNIPKLKAIGIKEFHCTAHQLIEASEGFLHPNFPKAEYQKKVFDVQKLQACLNLLS